MKELLKNAWHLPWKMNDAPHALLDILRGCNIKCQACYNDSIPKFKSLDEIKSDYEKIISLRNISSVAIIGGEPLLHPDLIAIIHYLKAKKLTVELFTNGLILDREFCQKLKKAGVDLIFLHIDEGQSRSDLPPTYTNEDLQNLRVTKAKMITDERMEAALSLTVRQEQINSAIEVIKDFTKSPFFTYFLITLYRDIASLGALSGDLTKDIKGVYKSRNTENEPEISKIAKLLHTELKLKPFGYLGGKIDSEQPRWLSYLVASSFNTKTEKMLMTLNMQAGSFEKFYLEKYKDKHKKYPFFNKQNHTTTFLQIIFNGIFGRSFIENFGFLFKNHNSNIKLKRLLIQSPAEILPDGRVEHCECCPDLTINKGKIVPVCICDNFS